MATLELVFFVAMCSGSEARPDMRRSMEEWPEPQSRMLQPDRDGFTSTQVGRLVVGSA